jgi:pimeloyl-ACP methyl ester carboxylesterase
MKLGVARHMVLAALVSFLFVMVPCLGAWAEPERELTSTVTIDSLALKGNLLGDPTKQPIDVCLPPSYFKTQKKYAVVYYFHGFSQTSGAKYMWGGFTALQQSGKMREFILVGVNGNNVYGGSFYVNSPVTGGWEDFTVSEVVNYIDAHYRTLAARDSRGLVGFSMGGFAALNIAFRHPDVYAAVYAYSPGVLSPGSMSKAMPTWDRTFRQAYGAAFAPDPAAAQFARIPAFDGSPEDEQIQKEWESGFGEWDKKVQNYLDKIQDIKVRQSPLRGIRIQFGVRDVYSWIPEGCVYLSGLLFKSRIPHELIVTPDAHSMGAAEDAAADIGSFFSKRLAFE